MRSVAVLDCESYESALMCFCRMYNTVRASLVDFLAGLDLEKEYARASSQYDGILTNLVESKFGSPTHSVERIAWFHLTRVPAETNFSEGILPLDLALEKVWQVLLLSLDDKQKKLNLEKLHRGGVPDFQYNFKKGNNLHSGPYAMLVRESAFHAEAMGNHDYLALPEIVEGICNGYQMQYGESIHDEVSRVLKRCIVKFEVPGHTADDIERALKYCWFKANNQILDGSANTCYDAEGRTIPHDAIRNIEFL